MLQCRHKWGAASCNPGKVAVALMTRRGWSVANTLSTEYVLGAQQVVVKA